MQTWSTEAVAPHERLDYWVGAICEAFLEMSCDSRNDQPFAGKLMHLQADAISFTQVIAAPAEVSRTRQAIARSKRALEETVIQGVKTTIPLYVKIMDNAFYQRGVVMTNFLKTRMDM